MNIKNPSKFGVELCNMAFEIKNMNQIIATKGSKPLLFRIHRMN
ncbi:15974_t:CDS:2 [Gigaspora margarita]|uniref:15974_t:CDS:1 n=1 Tax=Gigaspora margarita TaxID=4874 RepID=A0ABN7ULZ2_GIGMA|nr:15974_t:CDS:2 [Gigaspora margarita]